MRSPARLRIHRFARHADGWLSGHFHATSIARFNAIRMPRLLTIPRTVAVRPWAMCQASDAGGSFEVTARLPE